MPKCVQRELRVHMMMSECVPVYVSVSDCVYSLVSEQLVWTSEWTDESGGVCVCVCVYSAVLGLCALLSD